MSRPIHQRPTSFEFLRRLTDAHDRQTNEVKAAASLLGAEHRLVRTLDRLAVLRPQLLLTSVALSGGAIAILAEVRHATAVTVAAAVVELALVTAAAALTSLRRSLARQLVIDGRGGIPLPVLAHELRRLTSARTRASLAHALEHFLQTAERWPTILPNARPVFEPTQILAVATELRTIATLLNASHVEPRGVALVEQLLTAGTSPLYGHETDDLKYALDLILASLPRPDSNYRVPEALLR